jgi:hypothetical protein
MLNHNLFLVYTYFVTIFGQSGFTGGNGWSPSNLTNTSVGNSSRVTLTNTPSQTPSNSYIDKAVGSNTTITMTNTPSVTQSPTRTTTTSWVSDSPSLTPSQTPTKTFVVSDSSSLTPTSTKTFVVSDSSTLTQTPTKTFVVSDSSTLTPTQSLTGTSSLTTSPSASVIPADSNSNQKSESTFQISNIGLFGIITASLVPFCIGIAVAVTIYMNKAKTVKQKAVSQTSSLEPTNAPISIQVQQNPLSSKQVWTRHTEGEDVWFVSDSGESVWELPPGATYINR